MEFPALLTGDQYRDLNDQLGQQLDATNAGMGLFLRFSLSLISNILNKKFLQLVGDSLSEGHRFVSSSNCQVSPP